MTKDILLCFDAGTGSVKGALFDPAGRVLAQAAAPYPLLVPKHGWAEQRPCDWWAGMREVAHRLVENTSIDATRIAAINVSAQVCGTLPVDQSGRPLTNCLIWLDTRSASIARRITSGSVRIGGYGLMAAARWLWYTNAAPNRSGKDPISKILWFRENDARTYEQTHKFLDVKEYLIHRMCGQFVTTADCAHLTWLFDSRKHRQCWSRPLMRRFQLDEALFPAVHSTTEIIGELTSLAADELGLRKGIPIVAGVGDVAATALGAGAISLEDMFLHIGTSSWLGIHRRNRRVDPFSGIATLCAADSQKYLLVAAQECAGACVEWGARWTGRDNDRSNDFGEFDRRAQGSPPGAKGVRFYPWMFGERVPVQDEHIRGALTNLSLEHDAGDVARAILEGVSLNIRWALGSMSKMARDAREPIRFVGGGARSPLWCQVIADVLQRPIIQIERPDLSSARGAAMAAAVAVGWFSSLTDTAGMVDTRDTFYPAAASGELYDQLFDRFVTYYERNGGRHARLSGAGPF